MFSGAPASIVTSSATALSVSSRSSVSESPTWTITSILTSPRNRSFRLRGDTSWRQIGQNVLALTIRARVAHSVGPGVNRGDCRADDDGMRRILDAAGDRRCCRLRSGSGNDAHKEYERRDQAQGTSVAPSQTTGERESIDRYPATGNDPLVLVSEFVSDHRPSHFRHHGQRCSQHAKRSGQPLAGETTATGHTPAREQF